MTATERPLVGRDDLLRDQRAHPPYGGPDFAPPSSPVRVGVTGTGDGLLVLAWSAADLARERAAGARLLAAAGVAPGMRVANALAGALATPGSLLLGDVVEELGALDVPLGAPDNEAAAKAAWALADRVEADVLVLDPATAPGLLAAAPATARPWWRGVVWLRTAGGAAPPAIPAPAGFAGWQRSWLALPEATSFVAHGCDAGRFHPDPQVVVEVVDARGAAVAAGGRGTLVVTALGGERPAVRYASGLAASAPAPCTCGAGPALEVL